MIKRINIYLFLIVFFAAALRISYLTYNPPSLNWDEVSHGYNAYSILKTGMDEWGKLFPLTNFRAYGDYPLPLNLYLTIPFISIFGLNEFSIRLPHAIFGVLTVIATYYLGYGVTKKKKVGLLSAFLMAVEPWSLFPSRFVAQSNLSILLLTSGVAVFLYRERNKYLLPLSFLLWGLSLFAYHTTRIFSPVFLLGLLFIYRGEIKSRFDKYKATSVLSLILIIIFFVPAPFILMSPEARARGNFVFAIDQGGINTINSMRGSSNLPGLLKKLVFNKVTFFTYKFGSNYISYFSPKFLFIEGGTQFQFSVPNNGLLYLIDLPFFYIGIFVLAKRAQKNIPNYRIIMLWLILSPIPASLTNESFAVLRSSTMLPLPQLLTAIGLLGTLKFLSEKYRVKKSSLTLVRILFVIGILVLLENYMLNYLTNYRKDYSWAWQYGYKEVAGYVKDNYSKYDKIIFTKKYGEPHEFLLFFLQYSPEKYRNDPNLIRFNQSNWFWVDRFDKYYFVNDWQIPKNKNIFELESKKERVDCNKIKCLLVTSPANYPVGWKNVNTINFLDGKADFEMYENK